MSTIPLLHLWCAVLVGLALGWSTNPVEAEDPPLPTAATGLAAVSLQVLLRTADGTAVPGIGVTLVPAAADAGGPSAGANMQYGSTDGDGRVTFAGIQGVIWWARFQGMYQGQPLVPVARQGQPPYGTTRGGGLVVQTALQEENDAPAPVVGQPAPAVETLAFVLLPTGLTWTPAIDLAAPSAAPQPLGSPAAPTALPVRSAPQAGSVSNTAANRETELTLVWWLLPLGAAGSVLFVTWRQHQQEQRASLLSTDERGVIAAGAEGSNHV